MKRAARSSGDARCESKDDRRARLARGVLRSCRIARFDTKFRSLRVTLVTGNPILQKHSMANPVSVSRSRSESRVYLRTWPPTSSLSDQYAGCAGTDRMSAPPGSTHECQRANTARSSSICSRTSRASTVGNRPRISASVDTILNRSEYADTARAATAAASALGSKPMPCHPFGPSLRRKSPRPHPISSRRPGTWSVSRRDAARIRIRYEGVCKTEGLRWDSPTKSSVRSQ